jgi:DNA-binding XRE family transcriptional regulator
MRPADLDLALRTRAALASGAAREAREIAGARQADVAEAIGVSRQAVSKWEAGLCSPSTAHALAYGRLLRQLARRAA